MPVKSVHSTLIIAGSVLIFCLFSGSSQIRTNLIGKKIEPQSHSFEATDNTDLYYTWNLLIYYFSVFRCECSEIAILNFRNLININDNDAY